MNFCPQVVLKARAYPSDSNTDFRHVAKPLDVVRHFKMETHPYINKTGLITQLNLTPEAVQTRGYLDGGIWFMDTLIAMCGTYPPLREYQTSQGTIRKGYIHFSSPRNKYWRHVDNIYKTEFYIPSKIANNEQERIQNALNKIDFLETKKLGFIDVFSKVNRRVATSANDSDLIRVESIFDNGIFENVLQQSIRQFGFVYSLAHNTFVNEVEAKYNVKPQLIRPYNTDNIPLKVSRIKVHGKEIYLSYSPIHGNITDDRKRAALKKVIEFDI